MTSRGLKPETEGRLTDLVGAEPGQAQEFLGRKDRHAQLLRLVREDETENEQFYRELGDR